MAVLLLTGAALVAVRAADSSTPLIDAVKAGDRAEVRRLIARKADVNASEPDEYHGASLGRACGRP